MVEPVTINLRYLSRDLGLPQEQVQAVVTLLDDGHPIPFIARYRKDRTDNLDEDMLRTIEEQLRSLRALCERKQTILTKIDLLGQLTPELDKKIRDAKTAKKLEDLYLPFKPKRQTLASEARERGLEPLALEILDGKLSVEQLDSRASEFVDEDKKIKSVADALLGAGHIIAEIFSEKIEVIQAVRDFAYRSGKLVTSRVDEKPHLAGTPAPPALKKTKAKPAPETSVVETPVVEPVSEPTVEPVAEAKVETKIEETPAPESVVETVQETEPAVETETDSSGSGGGEEPVEESTAEPEDVPVETVPEPQTEAEQTVAEPIVEMSAEGPAAPVDGDVQAVTEQFQQWKEAQAEKGVPTVTSQNTLRKKKKAEAKKKKDEAKNRQREHFERQFHEYFNFSTGLRNMPPHRVLAINRGEKVKILKAKIEVDDEKILESTKEFCVPADHPHADFLLGCLKDALKKRVVPSIEREIRSDLTENAERQSIKVFAKNLRSLLLQPPLYRKRVLALDPGFRHGCKIVPLDEFGNVLNFETVYLHGNAERREIAVKKIIEMVGQYNISVIAIGNGTGCRETEEAVSKMIANHFADGDLSYVIVNEAGASVYSASPIAKEEFPNYDVMLRGAVSIGRRLQDPLNELVKIEPASLGVGMYQHDLKNKHLKDTLTEVVESCVNYVGVDLNTATPAILRYVAGLNAMTANRIYEFRKANGPFRKREDLKNVAGFGAAAFTHSAGFLKIPGGENPLDGTWIHPESYDLAVKILEKLGFTADDLRDAEKVKAVAAKIAEEKIGELASRLAAELAADPMAGLFTVRDILENLARPGRDPRESLPKPIFKKGVLHMDDLAVGMELTGTVLNVVDFGAFVDIGLHDSGLVHISQMSDGFIRDAHEKVSVGDVVRVWVVEADPKRHRISLTMLPPGTEKQPRGEGRRGHGAPHGDRPEQAREARPDRPPRRDDRKKEGTPSQEGHRGEGRRDGRRDDRPKRDRNDRRDGGRRDNRDRGPRTFTAAPKEKEVKPISEDMKKGKEPMRSFGDLAQLLGRVQVPDPEEEKRKKKEEERRRKEKERQKREQQAKAEAEKTVEPAAEPAPEAENKTTT